MKETSKIAAAVVKNDFIDFLVDFLVKKAPANCCFELSETIWIIQSTFFQEMGIPAKRFFKIPWLAPTKFAQSECRDRRFGTSKIKGFYLIFAVDDGF